MKELSHPGTGEQAALHFNHAIHTAITVATNEWKNIAEVVTGLDPTLPLVPCYVGELNQVLLNLIINAAHAIEEKTRGGSSDKGKISLHTHRDGNGVELRVSDTGSGISEPIRSKVFDPFFTAKEVGKATGQGLALAHSIIVQKHAGTITFESEAGQGTTFIVGLPLELMNGGNGHE